MQEEYVKRLNYIEGHVKGIRRMVEEDKYCVDILRQTFAVRKAIQKLEALILENHLRGCVPTGVREGREEQVLSELLELYGLAEPGAPSDQERGTRYEVRGVGVDRSGEA